MRLHLLFVVPLSLFACATPTEDEASTTDPLTKGATLAVGANGFTALSPASDARVVHVSSSIGNDANDGRSEAAPVRTIARGKSLLRDGYPDWLVFKRGDVFDASIATSGDSWRLSGRSGNEPMVIGAYGSGDRPRFDTTDSVFVSDGAAPLHDVAIVGLHFVAHRGDPRNPSGIDGMYWNRPGRDVLVEDCLVEGYRQNIVIQNLQTAGGGNVMNVTVRRNVVLDAWGTGNPQGVYLAHVTNLLLEENVLDHNGWNESVVGFGRNQFNHNAYIQATAENTTARRNVSVRGSSYGLESKGGKQNDVIDNVFSGNAQGLQYGSSRVGVAPNPDGAHGSVMGNVVLHSTDLSASNLQGQGIDIGNISAEGVVVSGNVIAHCDSAGPYGHAFFVEANLPNSVQGIKRATLEGNTVVDWPSAVQVFGRAADVLAIRNNTFEDGMLRSPPQPIISLHDGTKASWSFDGNEVFHAGRSDRWFYVSGTYANLAGFGARVGDTTSTSGRVAFHDPSRDLVSYARSIDLADDQALYAELRHQSAARWDARFTAPTILAYLREGYRP